MEGYVRAEVASDTLVALSRNHFSLVMYELQHHLKPLDLTDKFVIITLAKLAHGNGRARGTSAPASGSFRPAQGSLLVSASLHFCSCLCPTLSISLLPCLSLAFLFSRPRVFLSCEDSLCVSASMLVSVPLLFHLLQTSLFPVFLSGSILVISLSQEAGCLFIPKHFSLVPSPFILQTGPECLLHAGAVVGAWPRAWSLPS